MSRGSNGWILIGALCLPGCHRASQPTHEAVQNKPGRTVLVPGPGAGIRECESEHLDLRACLTELIEQKRGDEPLTIRIAPGEYTVGQPGGILIFQRKNIAIQGTPARELGGELPTRIRLDPSLAQEIPAVPLRTFAHVVDSSGISFSDISLEGSGLRLRGFGVCQLGGDDAHPTAGIALRRLEVHGFTDFVTVVGHSILHEYLHGTPGSDAALARLYGFTGASADGDDPRQYCEGEVHGITVEGNRFLLRSVGFYAVPLTVRQSRSFTGVRLPLLITGEQPGGSGPPWYQVVQATATKTSGIVLRSNQFIVDLEPSAEPAYRAQLEGYFHSAVKINGTSGLVIEQNTFDAAGNPDVFQTGAALDVAFGVVEPLIRDNTFRFPPSYRFPGRALVVNAGFGLHIWYGVGAMTFFDDGRQSRPMLTDSGRAEAGRDIPFGALGLGCPTIGGEIEGNQFDNAHITIQTCCSNTVEKDGRVLAWINASEFCRVLDDRNVPSPRVPALRVHDNVFHDGGGAGVVIDTAASNGQASAAESINASFVATHPEIPIHESEYCRSTVPVLASRNVLQP
jgi:hypothetical protein